MNKLLLQFVFPHTKTEIKNFFYDLSPLLSIFIFQEKLTDILLPFTVEIWIVFLFALFRWIIHILYKLKIYFKEVPSKKEIEELRNLSLLLKFVVFSGLILIFLLCVLLFIIFICIGAFPFLLADLYFFSAIIHFPQEINSTAKTEYFNLFTYLFQAEKDVQLVILSFGLLSLYRHGVPFLSFIKEKKFIENSKKSLWIFYGILTPPNPNRLSYFIETFLEFKKIERLNLLIILAFVLFVFLPIPIILTNFGPVLIYLYKAFLEMQWDRMNTILPKNNFK